MKCETYVMTVSVVIDTDKAIPEEFLSNWLEGACKDYTTYYGNFVHTLRIKEISNEWLADFLEALKAL